MNPDVRTTRSTCPYCGVGCGVLIDAAGEGAQAQIVGVRGDPDHPANVGRLCTKGSTLHLTATPLVRALLLSRDLGCDLRVKNETVSPIASFKWRGALNDLLRDANPRGVVTSSTGNHGQGVAWAARVAGVPAHIFLPLGANPTKRAKIELLGATIHDGGHDLDAAKAKA